MQNKLSTIINIIISIIPTLWIGKNGQKRYVILKIRKILPIERRNEDSTSLELTASLARSTIALTEADIEILCHTHKIKSDSVLYGRCS